MTTKTKHRITADKVVVEDDQRKKECNYNFDRMESDNSRQTPHDYSHPHKVIYVPVEPHLMQVDTPGQWHEVLINQLSPFHPDDTLRVEGDNLLSYDHEYNVVKILGVEERETVEEVPTLTNPIMMKPMFRDIWHWKILGKVKKFDVK